MGVRTRLRLRSVCAGAVMPFIVAGCGLMLGACSIPIADLPLIGVPADAPKRAEIQPAYLPVNDTPPPRDEAVLTTDEQKKLQKQLLDARDKQNADADKLAKSAGVTSSTTNSASKQ